MATESKPAETEETAEDAGAAMRRISRRSFIMAGIYVGGLLAGLEAVLHSGEDDGLFWPLRKMLLFNERISEAYFRSQRLAPLLSPDRITRPARTNGNIGLDSDPDLANWSLMVQPLRAGGGGADDYDSFSMADVRSLPRREMITEFHCIEGWTMAVKWTGARFSDFVRRYTRYARAEDMPRYVSVETPDGGYYVGLDRASAMHPQTLLCYEMNDSPLTSAHGAPLRLVIPVKYGVKNLKRIGVIRFVDARPADYWAEQGYDWYAGL